MMNNDLQIAHLLCTRLCHDLAGPVGAISAGVELMGTDPSLIDDETLSLLSGSADAAARKLKFLRIAFGWSGSGLTKFDDLERVFEDYLSATSGLAGAPSLLWPGIDDLTALGNRLGDGAVQILSNIALLGLECMPSCQSLTIEISANPSGLEVAVHNQTAPERTSKLREDMESAISNPDASVMSAQNVQAHLVGVLVAKAGGEIALAGKDNGAVVTAKWS